MRLIELSASEPSFHPVLFNREGLTLIVAKSSRKKDRASTYNGVGKSLIAKIIHFCLGSSKVPAFEEHLPNWTFYLTVELGDGSRLTLSRSTNAQGYVNVNGKNLSLSKFSDVFAAICFPDINETPFLKFRSLISHFIRQGKEGYFNFLRCVRKETDFQQLISNAYLLGVNPYHVLTKKRMKADIDRTRQTLKQLQSDEELSKYFGSERGDVNADIAKLNEQYRKIEESLSQFKFSDEFSDLSELALKADRAIKEKLNEKDMCEINLRHIALTLAKRASISETYVEKMFADARVLFGPKVRQGVKQALQFHAELAKARDARLLRERGTLRSRLEILSEELRIRKEEFDGIAKQLGDGGAFSEYITLANVKSEVARKIERLESFQNLVKGFEEKIENLNSKFDQGTEQAQRHLQSIADEIADASELFAEGTAAFYGERRGSIVIETNAGYNQTQYDINAHIESDASDGINSVKIFCYDMTVLLRRRGHKVDFVFHDSRLFSDMAYHQRASLFKLAHQASKANRCQYIASVNEEFLNSMRPLYTATEWAEIVEPSIVLELTDASPSSKLLGIQVDMEYDK